MTGNSATYRPDRQVRTRILGAVRALLVFVGVLGWACQGTADAQGMNDSATAVESAGDSLDGSWNGGFNWYDEETDGLRPLDLPKPDKPRATSGSGLGSGAGLADLFQGLAWGVLIILILLIILFAYHAFSNFEPTEFEKQEVSRRTELDRVEELPFDVKPPQEGLLAEARRQADAGRFDLAIIYLYSHMLVELDKHNFIRLAKGKTNRQYLAEVRRLGPNRRTLSDLLHFAMVAFEDTFFGRHPLERARFQECWDRLPAFQEQLARSEETIPQEQSA